MPAKSSSVQLDAETLERLNRVAQAMDRPHAWIIARAIRQFVEQEEWLAEAVRKGMKEAGEDRTVAHERVERWVDSWDSESESEPPRCG